MRTFVSTLTAFAALQTAWASPVSSRSGYAVKEDHFVPRKWTKIGIPSPDTIIDLKIGFKNKKFGELEKHLYEVSDPAHLRYGQHLSTEEVDNLVRPDDEAASLVDEWLETFGIPAHQRHYSPARDWITIALPLSHVERLLDTEYSVFRHTDGETLVRAPVWSLPLHLHDHIATIQPTTAFLKTSPLLATALKSPEDVDLSGIDPSLSTGNVALDCNFEAVTPNCLRTLYKTRDYTPKGGQNTVGFTNYLGQVPTRQDATLYQTTFRPDALNAAQNYREISIANGPTDNGTNPAGVEANLDVQTIIGITYPLKVTSYSTGGSPPFKPDLFTPTNTNEPYLTWLNYVLAQRSLPQTISTSYGDDEQTVPLSYALIVCQGLAQLGLRGTTLLFSSGDSGVGSDGSCQTNDGRNRTQFLPSFPASCPYITSVGGTRNFPEVVAYDTGNGYVSGSGFSNYFPRPAYQIAAVSSYLPAVNASLKGLYNPYGRAYPDIAAQGYRYAIFYNKVVVSVDGTSCSSPAAASVLSLVNDALIARGRRPLGFLNPLLYSSLGAKAFNDVLGGSSTGCGTGGFQARKGWDAATGFGTPDFKKIIAALNLS